MRHIDLSKKNSTFVAAKIALLSLFTYLFLILENSPLSDMIKYQLVFRHVIIPIPQWALISCFAAIWKYISGEKWDKVMVKGAILGAALCLYLPMLDTVKQTWTEVVLPGAYRFYINAYSFAVTFLLMAWASVVFRSAIGGSRGKNEKSFFGDIFFFPLFLTGIYAVVFYCLEGRVAEAGAFLIVFLTSLAIGRERDGKILSLARASLKRVFSDKRMLLILIFAIALAARLIFLRHLIMVEGPRYPYASDDGDTYDMFGWRGVNDPMIYIRESPHYFLVFYAVMLTVIYKIFGHSHMMAGSIQSVIGSLLCCLVFIFALYVTGKKSVAVLASLGVALDSMMIQIATTLNTEVLYIPFIVLIILLLYRYRETRQSGAPLALMAVSGFLLGLASIVRTLGLGLAALILPWLLFYGRDRKNHNGIKRARDMLVFILFMLLPIAPIIHVNYQNTGEFFMIYNNKYEPGTRKPSGFNEWIVESAWGEKLVPSNKRIMELGMVNPSTDPVRCVAAVLKRPVAFAKVFAEIIPLRTRNLFFWPSFGSFDAVYLLNPARIKNRYASSLEFYTIALFCAGFYFFIRSKTRAGVKVLTLLVIFYYWVFHGIFFLLQSARYSCPMRPFLYIIFSYGVYRIFVKFRSILRER